ncbi:MAG: collagen binding domain-containing protein [Coprobacillus cateniformis]
MAKQDNKGNVVPNTQFKISYNSDMTSPIGTYTTTSDGSVTINDLTPQNVYIQETSVPNHLVLDNTVHSIEIKTGETVTFTQTNNWKQGYIEVTKYDKKTNQIVKKSGTQFEILKVSTVVSTITTNANGVAKTGLLDYGTYIVREKSAPQNYVIATLTQNQDVVENNKTYSIKVYNEPVLGSVNLTKVDADTNTSVPQGDATLVDAEYVLKAEMKIF